MSSLADQVGAPPFEAVIADDTERGFAGRNRNVAAAAARGRHRLLVGSIARGVLSL